ncbi:MAG: cardiolipin synthase [Deltaproteobacteria bacterium]|nr:cardiolipin synthase [Deltaproteobacteria bacterium]
MNILHGILITINALLVMVTAGHALLYKRDPRAALGWISVCVIFPFAGPFLYILFGVNRVQTRAKKLHRRLPFPLEPGYEPSEEKSNTALPSVHVAPEFSDIARISDTVTMRSLVEGNRIQLLQNGEQAYPAMLEAIEGARKSLFLASYIFDTNDTGRTFIEALSRATGRGIDVRVIIDGVGELYSFPRAGTLLKKRGVRVARFIPPRVFPPMLHINLRNHRKILVTDGLIAFTGGMNIGDRHLADNLDNPSRVEDLHFRITGPVTSQVEQVFLEDWSFCTGEHTVQEPARTVHSGNAICRTIVEGPNEDMDKLSSILVGAVSVARYRVLIMTPYFLPSRALIAAMQTAALRGVAVDIILPGKNNLPFVHWASRNMLWELLQRGIRVYYQPPPFVHTKLFIVDDQYAQIGSANMDPRSLRLNFEMAMEIYDREVVAGFTAHALEKIGQSQEISLKDVDTRPLFARIRDGLSWLFTPYL